MCMTYTEALRKVEDEPKTKKEGEKAKNQFFTSLNQINLQDCKKE